MPYPVDPNVTLGSRYTPPAIPAAAGTLTGNTLAANVVNSVLTSVGTLVQAIVNALIVITGAAGTTRQLIFRTGGSNRWAIAADNTAEGGANAGSLLAISAYTDAAGFIDAPVGIVRAAGGAITLRRPVTVPGGTNLLTTTAALADSAAAQVATLNNAPVAGNPTKWITISDQGVNRRVPVW